MTQLIVLFGEAKSGKTTFADFLNKYDPEAAFVCDIPQTALHEIATIHEKRRVVLETHTTEIFSELHERGAVFVRIVRTDRHEGSLSPDEEYPVWTFSFKEGEFQKMEDVAKALLQNRQGLGAFDPIGHLKHQVAILNNALSRIEVDFGWSGNIVPRYTPTTGKRYYSLQSVYPIEKRPVNTKLIEKTDEVVSKALKETLHAHSQT